MNKNERQTFSARTVFTNADARIKISRKKFADGTEATTLTGYPIVWGAVSSDRGGYKVKLAKNSATFTDPVMALWHHNFAAPLSGTVNQTLRILAADDIGIPVEIDLDLNTTAGSDALAYVSSKLVGGMSFSMANGFEEYTEEKDGDDRILNVSKYTVDEVTITPIPAFSATTIGKKPDEADQQEPQELEPLPAGTPPVAGGMSQSLTPNGAKHRIEAANRLRSMKLELLKN